MLLNEDFSFETGANATVKRAFIAGKPEDKVVLGRGTKLYKYTQHPLLGPHGITPWWSLAESKTFSCGALVPGFKESGVRSQRLGVAQKDFERVRAAVTKQWNQMSQLLLVELTQDVYAFLGKALGQLADQDVQNVFLIGGEYQLWIPNLTPAHVRQIHSLG